MLAAAATVGMVLLLAIGVWQLSRARLAGLEVKQTQLVSEDVTVFSGRDLQDPGRILKDRDKLVNAATIALEVLVVLAAAAVGVAVLTHPVLPVYYKAVAVGALLVGGGLVARALYVRLGLYHPALETLTDYRDSLTDAVDDAVAEEFTSIHSSFASARGDDVDEVTVSVLAAAKNENDLDAIAEWGESVGIADAEEFEARATTLAEADLIERDGSQLRIGEPLQDADDAQVATVAASVMN